MLQHWVNPTHSPSPEGTAEPPHTLSRPFGTDSKRPPYPTLKRWAILSCPSGTNPSFCNSDGGTLMNPIIPSNFSALQHRAVAGIKQPPLLRGGEGEPPRIFHPEPTLKSNPEGILENSPMLQHWVNPTHSPSPEGTAEPPHTLSRPFGTDSKRPPYPTLKRWAILSCPSGTNPSFCNSDGGTLMNPIIPSNFSALQHRAVAGIKQPPLLRGGEGEPPRIFHPEPTLKSNPEGILENSPMLQHWVNPTHSPSPEGTAEPPHTLSRPFGTDSKRPPYPTLKRWAILSCPSGTNPSFCNSDGGTLMNPIIPSNFSALQHRAVAGIKQPPLLRGGEGEPPRIFHPEPTLKSNPEGILENSPMLQHWVNPTHSPSPEGTAEPPHTLSRPFGTDSKRPPYPTLKRWAILSCPSGTNPSFCNSDGGTLMNPIIPSNFSALQHRAVAGIKQPPLLRGGEGEPPRIFHPEPTLKSNPEGILENSPMLQHWVNPTHSPSPEGTAEPPHTLSRPFGTDSKRPPYPTLKRWAILSCPSGTNPSFCNSDGGTLMNPIIPSNFSALQHRAVAGIKQPPLLRGGEGEPPRIFHPEPTLKSNPEGILENSPMLQHWVNPTHSPSPEGTAEPPHTLSRPFGTDSKRPPYPTLKRWAILSCPSGTNPSFCNSDGGTLMNPIIPSNFSALQHRAVAGIKQPPLLRGGEGEPPGVFHPECILKSHPEGILENSLMLQHWVNPTHSPSPEGTADPPLALSRPFGTDSKRPPYPTLKRWAILRCPSGTNPSFCNGDGVDLSRSRYTFHCHSQPCL